MRYMGAAWFVPTVILGSLGLLIQGVKAGWDLIMSIRSHRNSRDALMLQEVNALMNLVAGLPLAESRKAAWKVKLVRLIQQRAPISEVYGTLDALIAEIVGGDHPKDGSI